MMRIEPAAFQRICAASDAHGNPRRLYTIYGTDGSLLVSIDYEHFGQPRQFDEIVELPAFSVSVEEYQRSLPRCFRRRRVRRGGNGVRLGVSEGRSVRVNPLGVPPSSVVDCDRCGPFRFRGTARGGGVAGPMGVPVPGCRRCHPGPLGSRPAC